MLLCTECESFVKSFDTTASSQDRHCITRSPSSFTDAAFRCRLCATVWAKLYFMSKSDSDIPQSIYLILSKPTVDEVVLDVEIDGKGGTWIIDGKYDKVLPKDIPAYLKEHGYDEDPRKYLVTSIGKCSFKIQSRNQLEAPPARENTFGKEESNIETEEPSLGWHSQPIEFFQQFLPQLTQWLDICDRKHSICHEQQRPPSFPTRLVYVGTQPGQACLRLREQIPRGSRYLTLSYRWGREFLCLRKTNFYSWLDHIPEESFPLTVRDAIAACRLLHVDYIWIDALTILQDDYEDWSRESSAMADIYSGSYLNLAASATSNVDDGLFRRCNEVLTDGKPLTFQLADGSLCIQSKSEFHGYPDVFNPDRTTSRMFHRDIDESPLHRRGWVLQELYLSRRTLHFCDLTFWFQCKSVVTFGYPETYHALGKSRCFQPGMMFTDGDVVTCLDDPPIKPPRRWPFKFKHLAVLAVPWLLFSFYSLCRAIYLRLWISAALIVPGIWISSLFIGKNLPSLSPTTGAVILEEWLKLSKLYVNAKLTRESDRQVAIAGLANHFAARFQKSGQAVTYHAGLWSFNLITQLLWTTWDGSWTMEDKKTCPSWSWLYRHAISDSSSSSGLTNIKMADAASFKSLADIVEVTTVPQDEKNPFGTVKFGRLSLLAHFFTTTIRFNDWDGRHKGVPRLEMHMDVAYKVACPDVGMRVTVLDEESGARSMMCSDSDEEFVFVVLAYGESFPGPVRYHGLILQRTPHDYPLLPDDRDGDYWLRRGTWDEDIERKWDVDNHETRKLIEAAIAADQPKTLFEIV